MANFDLENYVTVAERIAAFRTDFPTGSIITEVLEATEDRVLVKAEVYRDSDDLRPSSTGHAEERRADGYVNKTSAIENCESSAAGRALALLNYSVDRSSIASREEIAGAKEANAELDRRSELKRELKVAAEQWVAISEATFDTPAEAALAFMRDELLMAVEPGAQLTPEQWDELERRLEPILSA